MMLHDCHLQKSLKEVKCSHCKLPQRPVSSEGSSRVPKNYNNDVSRGWKRVMIRFGQNIFIMIGSIHFG
jgi:hypothetical protein